MYVLPNTSSCLLLALGASKLRSDETRAPLGNLRSSGNLLLEASFWHLKETDRGCQCMEVPGTVDGGWKGRIRDVMVVCMGLQRDGVVKGILKKTGLYSLPGD